MARSSRRPHRDLATPLPPGRAQRPQQHRTDRYSNRCAARKAHVAGDLDVPVAVRRRSRSSARLDAAQVGGDVGGALGRAARAGRPRSRDAGQDQQRVDPNVDGARDVGVQPVADASGCARTRRRGWRRPSAGVPVCRPPAARRPSRHAARRPAQPLPGSRPRSVGSVASTLHATHSAPARIARHASARSASPLAVDRPCRTAFTFVAGLADRRETARARPRAASASVPEDQHLGARRRARSTSMPARRLRAGVTSSVLAAMPSRFRCSATSSGLREALFVTNRTGDAVLGARPRTASGAPGHHGAAAVDGAVQVEQQRVVAAPGGSLIGVRPSGSVPACFRVAQLTARSAASVSPSSSACGRVEEPRRSFLGAARRRPGCRRRRRTADRSTGRAVLGRGPGSAARRRRRRAAPCPGARQRPRSSARSPRPPAGSEPALLRQVERPLRTAQGPLAVGHDGDVARSVGHPAGGPQLGKGLGPFTCVVGG